MTQTLPDSPPPLCLLTLLAPQASEDALLDLLAACPELQQGYILVPAQGLGAGTQLLSVMEQVQGRARRVLVQAVVRQDDWPALLQKLRAQLPSPEVAYWLTPLLAQGRLA
ncbi:MAG: DUF3240 family protein [Hylemonella sp.]